MMNLITTQMQGVVGSWKLVLTRNEAQSRPEFTLWSAIRYPADKPKIPPYGQMLTTKGWEPVLREHMGSTLYVGEARIEQIVHETCV
jgi:hypothetical protein